MPGKFVVLEGIGACGKSTQSQCALEWARKQGFQPVLTREPGGTPFAEQLRRLAMSPEYKLGPSEETALMVAARSHHIRNRILPDLEKGYLVLCDRFFPSTYAYQGGGRQYDEGYIFALENAILGMNVTVIPDLILIYDIPVELQNRRRGRNSDKFDSEASEFQQRVRHNYLIQAKAQPSIYKVIDGTQPIVDVTRATLQEISKLYALEYTA